MDALNPSHYEQLYEVMKEHDPTFAAASFDHFVACMNALDGWAVMGNDEVVGMVGLTGFKPGLDVVLHGVVRPDWRGKWITRRHLKMVFGRIFEELKVPRVSGYMVSGLNEDQLSPFFAHLGFVREGVVRKGFLLKGESMDLVLVGMLREECRWL